MKREVEKEKDSEKRAEKNKENVKMREFELERKKNK